MNLEQYRQQSKMRREMVDLMDAKYPQHRLSGSVALVTSIATYNVVIPNDSLNRVDVDLMIALSNSIHAYEIEHFEDLR